MEIVLVIIALIAAYFLIVYVIIPVLSVALPVLGVVIAGYALVVSLISFFKALKDNTDPYKTYVDIHPDIPPGVKRNYCFGPGFHQIGCIIKDAFTNLGVYRQKLTVWKDKAIRYTWIIDIWIYLAYGLAVAFSQVLGFIWVAIFSVVLACAITVGVVFFFAFFTVLLTVDRLALLVKSIQNRCSSCKRLSIIPVFICPTCGLEHKKLVPGPYGVTKRKCTCGTELPTTFLGGRSKLEAHCPFCGTELYSSSSQQYGIQLVGGIGTGKTTFLAAFWHEYTEWLKQRGGIPFSKKPEDAFEELEEWFRTGAAEATAEKNASMYSIIHSLGDNTSTQMTIYDIAGEVFDYSDADNQQQQYKYCEGYLMIVDPTASPDYIAGTISNFINTMEEMAGRHTSKTTSVPVAVIITKADQFKKEIGLPRIKSTFRPGPDPEHPKTLAQHQNEVCRYFLYDHGFENVINLIDAEFSNVSYFPVSAMGHKKENSPYEPWGVLDPVFWLMSSNKCPLRGIIPNK